MRLMIVFVIALIVTCISAKDKDEGEFGLEIRLQVRPRPRQLLHYDIASIYTHQHFQIFVQLPHFEKN